MIHTFELSRVFTGENCEERYKYIIDRLKMRYIKRPDMGFYMTTAFAEQGFQMIRLYKFKDKMYEKQMEGLPKDDRFLYLYMIALSINPSKMMGGDVHLPADTLIFTPDLVKAVYSSIVKLVPCLDNCPDERKKAGKAAQLVQQGNTEYLETWKEAAETWLMQNAFLARRIDFTYDVYYCPRQYLRLIDMGYSLRKRQFERSYFDDERQNDDDDKELDIPDIEDVQGERKSESDVDYIYYRGKGLNINIYHKGTEILKEGLGSNPEKYDFVRIEVQAKKSRLAYILTKKKKGKLPEYSENQTRELQYLVSPEAEEDILTYYVEMLTGKGIYVRYDRAAEIIEASSYKSLKQEKMKAILREVAERGGIANLLEQVENGTITHLGALSTVKTHLRDIHKLGINPVTIPEDMDVPKMKLTDSEGNVHWDECLPSLTDVIRNYSSNLKDHQREDYEYTAAELEGL